MDTSPSILLRWCILRTRPLDQEIEPAGRICNKKKHNISWSSSKCSTNKWFAFSRLSPNRICDNTVSGKSESPFWFRHVVFVQVRNRWAMYGQNQRIGTLRSRCHPRRVLVPVIANFERDVVHILPPGFREELERIRRFYIANPRSNYRTWYSARAEKESASLINT